MLTATKSHSSGNTSAILPLILVFLCGVSVGALAMNLGIHGIIHREPPSRKAENAMTLERWKRDLALTDKQYSQVDQILQDFSKLMDNVVADGNTRILQILDDGQKAKFQKMMKDRR